jgi:iron complex transport system ATP-binding protein
LKISNKNSVLSTQNLCVGYPDLTVISDINIEINKGKFICILGKNGSGKSTLVRTLAQLQDQLSGFIFFNEKKTDEYTIHELAKIFAIVLTERLPESLLQVVDIVKMGRHAHSNWLHQLTERDQEKIDFAIRETHIKNLLNKKFSALSDGQKQRVMLTKAIAQDTDLIFLDEPTAHLDVHFQMESFLLLQKLAHQHQKTIVVATHEIGLATQLADELWLIDNQSIETGTPKDLIASKKIAHIFDSELIRFNSKTSTFEFRSKN